MIEAIKCLIYDYTYIGHKWVHYRVSSGNIQIGRFFHYLTFLENLRLFYSNINRRGIDMKLNVVSKFHLFIDISHKWQLPRLIPFSKSIWIAVTVQTRWKQITGNQPTIMGLLQNKICKIKVLRSREFYFSEIFRNYRIKACL